MIMSEIMINTELIPLIAIPKSMSKKITPSVIIAMDKPKERAIFSKMLSCPFLKNTNVNTNPGKKNTETTPKSVLKTDA
jgi:hypothetical protein